MSKFIIVKKAPSTLGKEEMVMSSPNFLDEVEACAARAPRNGLTAINHMRGVLTAIQTKYDADLNIVKLPLSQYEGLPFSSSEDLSKIVVSLLKKERPDVFEKVLEYNIKNRPYGSKLVYYVGHIGETGPFFRNGIDMIEEKDVEEFLGHKPKKVVGKPAVTKEQSLEPAVDSKITL